MTDYPPLEVKVWGEFACFTRPEMKVERVSYDVITPSAARGVLEAIFWKPEFSWQIREIHVLKPIRHFSILRNEVNNKAVISTAKGWQEDDVGYFAEEDRAQRHSLCLRDVAYLIRADIVLNPHATDDVAKYRDQFRRRVSRGQCHSVPYLGCREFSAHFGAPDTSDRPVGSSDDLGRMLFDMDYASDGSSRGKPRFFQARLLNGILSVPADLYVREGSRCS
jgi:CRISPR-associated protein Cas5d